MCTSSTKPARKSAPFNAPPPSHKSRSTFHFFRSQRDTARQFTSVPPAIFTSSASARSRRHRAAEMPRLASTMSGEKRC